MKNEAKVYLKILYNYATKSDSKNPRGVDTSDLAEGVDLASLKSDVNKLDIDILSKLDVDELKPVPVDLKNLGDVVDKNVPKNQKIIQTKKGLDKKNRRCGKKL